jgi:hypothetical protein
LVLVGSAGSGDALGAFVKEGRAVGEFGLGRSG